MNDANRKRLLERKPDGKPSHPYTRSGETDVAATFKRIRKQQAEAAKLEAAKEKPKLAVQPTPIKRRA